MPAFQSSQTMLESSVQTSDSYHSPLFRPSFKRGHSYPSSPPPISPKEHPQHNQAVQWVQAADIEFTAPFSSHWTSFSEPTNSLNGWHPNVTGTEAYQFALSWALSPVGYWTGDPYSQYAGLGGQIDYNNITFGFPATICHQPPQNHVSPSHHNTINYVPATNTSPTTFPDPSIVSYECNRQPVAVFGPAETASASIQLVVDRGESGNDTPVRHVPVNSHTTTSNHHTSALASPGQLNLLQKLDQQPRQIAPAKRKMQSSLQSRDWKLRKDVTVSVEGKDVASMQEWSIPRVKKPRSSTNKSSRPANPYGACNYHRGRHERCCRQSYNNCGPSPQSALKSSYKIVDVCFFREGPAANLPIYNGRKELSRLKNVTGAFGKPIYIRLTQGIATDDLILPVQQFVPCKGDKLHRVWFENGKRREIRMPEYCIAELKDSVPAMCCFINKARPQYLENVIAASPTITRLMLLKALEYQQTSKSPLLRDVLNCLAILRMIEVSWRITGHETLGINPIMDEACPWNGIIPTPPIICNALDQIVLKGYLKGMRMSLLSKLQETMKGDDKRTCFEVMLAVFVFATNVQLLLKHLRRHALRYNAQQRYNSIPLAREFIRGHNIILSYFHVFIRDLIPSSSPQSRKDGILSSESRYFSVEEREFLRQIRELVKENWHSILPIRDAHCYEDDLYFSSQVFERDWSPESLDIKEATSVQHPL